MTVYSKELSERLILFGLGRTETLIYLYLLERGSEVGGTNIATGLKLHRQYIYNALPKLFELGLIEEVPRGKQHKYKALPPIALERIGRKQAIVASDLSRDLNLISNIGNEQDFEVVQGVKSIQQLEFQLLEQSTNQDVDLIIGGATKTFFEIMGDTLEDYLEQKEQIGVGSQYIGAWNERELFDAQINKYGNQQYRFLKNMPSGITHTVIRKNTVSFYSFLQPPLVYIIHSEAVAKHYADFFHMLWDMAGE
jgi:sugar-specific transcriptional regulator TrmB